jgi:circadian clock protein KaiB
MSEVLMLRLYIAGNAPNSLHALANAKAICAEHFPDSLLEIIDLMTEPRRGLADKIIVTPTLLKLLPLPSRRLVGDLSDARHVRVILEAK